MSLGTASVGIVMAGDYFITVVRSVTDEFTDASRRLRPRFAGASLGGPQIAPTSTGFKRVLVQNLNNPKAWVGESSTDSGSYARIERNDPCQRRRPRARRTV
jgi:hypothetical protein